MLIYRKCRAGKKETSLVEKYAEYFEEEKVSSSRVEIEAATAMNMLPDLDFNYLMKSSLAI